MLETQINPNNLVERIVEWATKNNKRLFFISIIIDLIGISSYLFPIIGEIFDVIWGPLGSILLYQLYGNIFFSVGLGVEEILPGISDWIPTALIAFVFKLAKEKQK